MVTEPARNVTTELRSLTALYDGACPLSRREVMHVNLDRAVFTLQAWPGLEVIASQWR